MQQHVQRKPSQIVKPAKNEAEMEEEMETGEKIKTLTRKTETLKKETERLTKAQDELKQATAEKDEMLSKRQETIEKLQATIEDMLNASEGQRVKIDDKLLSKGPSAPTMHHKPAAAAAGGGATPASSSVAATAPAPPAAPAQPSSGGGGPSGRGQSDAPKDSAKGKGKAPIAPKAAVGDAAGEFYDNGIDFSGDDTEGAGGGAGGKGQGKGRGRGKKKAAGGKKGGEEAHESLESGGEDVVAEPPSSKATKPKEARAAVKPKGAEVGSAGGRREEEDTSHSRRDSEAGAEATSKECLKIRDSAWAFHQQVGDANLSCGGLLLSDSCLRF